MAERKLKPFVTNSLLKLQELLFIAVGTFVYSLAEPMITGMSDVSKALPDPSKITNPQEFLDAYFTGMLKGVFTKETKNPVSLILFLFTVLFTSVKYPVDITNLISERYFERDARKKIRPRLLDISASFNAVLRDLISKEDMQEILSSHGFTDNDINTMEKLFYTVPSVQDVISFAVREVYSPEIAEQFGQFEGSNEVYQNAKQDIKAAGLTEETFRKFWAAHWILPSINQGFEMLHRQVISPEDLDRLFKALDIMPFWRDKLKDISYSPFTRVDVRRMHKMGVLSEDEVYTAYTDIGYSPEKARKMTDFTIAYNADEGIEDQTLADTEKAAAKDLTKGDILRMYRNRLLTESETGNYLETIGFNTELVSMLIAREDFIRDEDEVNDYIKLYKISYIDGVISETDLISKFGELNLPDAQQKYYIKLWDIERDIKTSVPTKAELFGFYRNKVIDAQRLRQELRRRGYIDEYIDWYVSGLDKEV